MQVIAGARDAHAPFVVGCYVDEVLVDDIHECPLSDGEPCVIGRHCTRPRKTGPTHSLVVLRCRVHEANFTVYPRDYRPYARRALVGGPALFDAPAELEVVDRVAEAARLPPPAGAIAGLSWSSLLRIVAQMRRLFALGDAAARELVAIVTGLNLADLAEAAASRGMRCAAAAIGRLRRQLSADALLDLGGRLGLWRPPRRWDARRWALVALTDPRGPPSSSGSGAPEAAT
jgi:hypothetical protein